MVMDAGISERGLNQDIWGTQVPQKLKKNVEITVQISTLACGSESLLIHDFRMEEQFVCRHEIGGWTKLEDPQPLAKTAVKIRDVYGCHNQ